MADNLVQGKKLHRLVKLIMDSGEANSIEEAQQTLDRYRLGIFVGNGVVDSPSYQAALLTAINTSRRCFLGGVLVTGNLDVPLLVPWKRCSTLAEAIIDLQGQITWEIDYGLPGIFFGDEAPAIDNGQFSVRPIIHGWNGGVVPACDLVPFLPGEKFTPSGVLAGALAVSEAFQYIRGDNPLAGHRSIGFSLWQPDINNESWLNADSGPLLTSLPAKLWLIGLGHLGQAYLWTLGFLPYPMESGAKVVLQDFDALEDANDSTSLLTNKTLVGKKKTRAMAAWCEERGFLVTIIERKFMGDFRIQDTEPALALCGVDNIEARNDLEKVGFQRIIEAGLGKGTQEYLGLKVHTFPSSRIAEQCWAQKAGVEKDNPIEGLIQQPAYQNLYNKGLDHCGLIELAGHSVGASFVGAVASTLVIAQALRIVRGENIYELIDADLRSSSVLSCVVPNRANLGLLNPGLIHI